jgi:hypothetical protein
VKNSTHFSLTMKLLLFLAVTGMAAPVAPPASAAGRPGDETHTGFAFGVPIQEHQAQFGTAPPLNLESWQFATPEQEQQYYEMYPQQLQYDRTKTESEPTGPSRLREVSRAGGFKIMRASFQARSDRNIERNQMRCGNTGCGPTITQVFPGLGGWAKDTGVACGGIAGGLRSR